MKTIVMDSANKYLVVALYENQKCLASLQEEGNRKQSEYAIVYLQKLLQENYLKMSDFDENCFFFKGDGRNEKSYFYFRCKKP